MMVRFKGFIPITYNANDHYSLSSVHNEWFTNHSNHILRRLFVTCDVFARYFFVAFSWLFRGFFVALICLEKKQCLGVFRGFFVVFS